MTGRSQEVSREIWENLSRDAQKLAIYVATGGGLSQGMDFLQCMAEYPEDGFDLERGMSELLEFGLLEIITLAQEKKEMLAGMPKPRDLLLVPLSEIPQERLRERLGMELTEEERRYFRLIREVEEYGAKKGENPERYESWEEPRYRLIRELQAKLDLLLGQS